MNAILTQVVIYEGTSGINAIEFVWSNGESGSAGNKTAASAIKTYNVPLGQYLKKVEVDSITNVESIKFTTNEGISS